MSLLTHMERWKDIEGYEGLYLVSSCGRVKSQKYGKERILKPGKAGRGYCRICLCKDGKIKTFTVHRLVALSFLPNKENHPYVNHKDEVKTNNYVSNLEWCTAQYNKEYSSGKKVLCVETGKVYKGAHEAARQTGALNSNIIQCCKGKRKTAGGYHWQYVDQNIKNYFQKRESKFIGKN